MNLSLVVKESLAVQSDGFVKIVESAIDLLRGESGRIGNLTISERLVKLEPLGEAVVVGDLHGDLESLISILKSSGVMQKMARSKDATLIFLGDYGDRGAYSAEVYYTISKLKLAFPEQVILLRGNHEGPEDLMASPHDLPMQFQYRFREKWATAYGKIRELFAYLYNAVLVEGRYLMVHAGLSPKINSIRDLVHAEQDVLEDLLWSDPNDMVQGVSPSPRGAARTDRAANGARRAARPTRPSCARDSFRYPPARRRWSADRCPRRWTNGSPWPARAWGKPRSSE